jgi:hypothetical protein
VSIAFCRAAVSSVVASPLTPSVLTLVHSDIGGVERRAGATAAGRAFSGAMSALVLYSPI